MQGRLSARYVAGRFTPKIDLVRRRFVDLGDPQAPSDILESPWLSEA